MAEQNQQPTADKPHIMIVEARFYDELLDELLAGAKEALEAADL